MKRILYLSFYFEPDLCAGSFRNSPLAVELANQLEGIAEIDLYTTMPNRYRTYNKIANKDEKRNNLHIHRIEIPSHKSGLLDQINSFKKYYSKVKKLTKYKTYDLVFASSSRLFTAYLGYSISKSKNTKLYLDIRDIFYDGLKALLHNNLIKLITLPIIKRIEKMTFSNADHINLISGGFLPYFSKYNNVNTTLFTNGIDDEFLKITKSYDNIVTEKKRVLYAGNIGEGQGLHKLIPQLANNFVSELEFYVIGDGGAKQKLISSIKEFNCKNVILKNPVSRKQLLQEYQKADFFLIHLNDFVAFKKVLPSKVFELGAFNKPILAGVAGYAAKFIKENIPNVILFYPCDVKDCTNKIKKYKYQKVERKNFIEKFRRSNINAEMAKSIISYL